MTSTQEDLNTETKDTGVKGPLLHLLDLIWTQMWKEMPDQKTLNYFSWLCDYFYLGLNIQSDITPSTNYSLSTEQWLGNATVIALRFIFMS